MVEGGEKARSLQDHSKIIARWNRKEGEFSIELCRSIEALHRTGEWFSFKGIFTLRRTDRLHVGRGHDCKVIDLYTENKTVRAYIARLFRLEGIFWGETPALPWKKHTQPVKGCFNAATEA